MSDSKIEWTDKTWNIISGCSPISEGCKNCYAARMAKRLAGRYGYDKDEPFKVTFHQDRLDDPLMWKKPSKIFVCSMGDLFHEDVQERWINEAWLYMALAKQHTYIILTKRPNRMLEYFASWQKGDLPGIFLGDSEGYLQSDGTRKGGGFTWPLPNVWLGVTCENQKAADERIPILLQIPAAVRFVSAEPMLGKINLTSITPRGTDLSFNAFKDNKIWGEFLHMNGNKIDWVICGAETGPGKRPMDLQWAKDLQTQCELAGVPFFFKKDSNKQFPADMKREWPK